MHWFSGIGWDTPVRSIGWMWVGLALLSIYLVWCMIQLVLVWRDEEPMKVRGMKSIERHRPKLGWAKGYLKKKDYYLVQPKIKGIEICLWKYQLVWTWR